MEPISTAVGTAKAIAELDPGVERFAEEVTGAGRRELGEWLADKVRFRRWKAQLRMFEKAKAFADRAGYGPEAVPLNVLAPLLDAGSLEDDESMADRWAALLANAARPTPTGESNVPPSFPEVLKQLTPIEAHVLDLVFENSRTMSRDKRYHSGVVASKLRELLHIEEGTFALSVDNLYRLRLCSPPAVAFEFLDRTQDRYLVANADLICLTDFGLAFVRACRPPDGGAVSGAKVPAVGTTMAPAQGISPT